MAKYELQPIQSMYRDTGSVQVNQMKRQEFLANIQADNALSTSVMNMEAMDEDFEGMNSLADKYNNNIAQRGQRKDYENLGMSINRDAMDFVKDYTPYKKSLDYYKAYKKSLEDSYKEGNITAATKDGRLAQSRANYKGIQTTPSGTVDQDSYFKGKGFSNDVDINAAIQKEFSDTDIRKMDLREIDTLVDAKFIPVFNEEAGAIVWNIQQGNMTEGIPATLANDVVMRALNRPDVKSTLAQQAELETYDTQNPEEALTTVFANLNSKINELKSKTGLSKEDKKVNDADIVNLERYVGELDKLSSDPLNALKNNKYNELQENIRKSSINKYAYTNVTARKTYKLLDADGVGSKNDTVPSAILHAGVQPTLTGQVTGGHTMESINLSITSNTEILEEIEEKYSTEDVKFDLNLLYDADTPEEMEALVENMKLGEATVEGIVNTAKRTRDNIQLAELRKREAMLSTLNVEGEETYNEALSRLYVEENGGRNNGSLPSGFQSAKFGPDQIFGSRGPKYEEIKDGLISLGEIPQGSSIVDALDYLQASQQIRSAKGYTPDASSSGGMNQEIPMSGDGLFYAQRPVILEKLLGEIYNARGVADEVDMSDIMEEEIYFEQILIRHVNNLNTHEGEADAKLKNDEIKFDALVDTSFGSMKKDAKEALHKVIKTGLQDNTMVYDGNGEKISFAQYVDQNYDPAMSNKQNYKILPDQSGLVNVSNQQGEPMLAIGIQNTGASGEQSGKIEWVFINADQMDVVTGPDRISPLKTYTNSVQYKMMTLFSNGEAHNVSKWAPDVFTNVTFDYTSSTPIVVYTDDSKTEILRSYTKKEGLDYLSSVVKDKGLEKYIY